ncbi:MAG TPA: DNA polymerase Y family protein [Pseudonocardiaceae bacterium]|nr:DNA polymerase Y family protein [Pseudonocardiaceae bacterium]
MAAGRVIVVWCPDWPVVAAGRSGGLGPQAPAVVVAANRVVACSASARAAGVRRRVRRRDAQARCPELVVFEQDHDRDARAFEPVVAAVEELAPGVEVVRPGVVAVPARGPVGYFGGTAAVAERLLDHVAVRTGAECQVGIADGLFAAVLAAHRGLVVPVGGSPEFLAPLSIAELDRPGELPGRDGRSGRPELVDLLRRLGLRTLGAFAALAERDVTSRLGADAVFAHRLAAGRVLSPLARRRLPPELAVAYPLDPPAERVDTAAFAARVAATRLHDTLAGHGLSCVRLTIQAETTAGEHRDRTWRCAEPLTMAGIADRVRWQLEGWLSGGTGRPSAGISLLRLVPEDVVDSGALQIGLWSTDDDSTVATERAGRALVRVQGLLGQEGVVTAVTGGGRGPADRVRLVPWGDERVPRADPAPPWPGRLPEPSPALLPRQRLPAVIWDEDGAEVGVTGRLLLSALPHRISLAGAPARAVRGWSAPWPVVERWWDEDDAQRAVRLQVLLAGTGGSSAGGSGAEGSGVDGGQTAVLLLLEGGRWRVEGIYD